MDKYGPVFNDLEKNLHLIDPKLKSWNIRYYKTHKKRYKSILKLVKKEYTKGKILEVGSAPFHLTFCLKKLEYPIIGLDLDPKRSAFFIKKHKLTIKKGDIESQKFPFKDNTFDMVLFSEVFEHLRIDPITTMKEINRILKPEGKLILTTPNLYAIDRVVRFFFGQGINNAYEEFNKLHTLGHMGHIREYTQKELKLFLINTNFEITKTRHKIYNKLSNPFFNLILNIIYIFTLPWWRPFHLIIAKKKTKGN